VIFRELHKSDKNLTPQPPSHLSITLPYKGREKEKLLFLEGGERINSPARIGEKLGRVFKLYIYRSIANKIPPAPLFKGGE
jgi:hypothetical protein